MVHFAFKLETENTSKIVILTWIHVYDCSAESVGSNQASCSQPPSNQDKSQPTSKEAPPEEDFYSDIYFDSDDEKEEASTSKQSKKTILCLFCTIVLSAQHFNDPIRAVCEPRGRRFKSCFRENSFGLTLFILAPICCLFLNVPPRPPHRNVSIDQIYKYICL